MAKKKIAALLIAAAVAAGGWALPARVSAAENDGTAVTWQQDETESSEQNSDEEAAVQEQSGTSENETPAVTIPGEDNEQEPEEKLPCRLGETGRRKLEIQKRGRHDGRQRVDHPSEQEILSECRRNHVHGSFDGQRKALLF